MEINIPQNYPSTRKKDRSHFFRKVICDAQLDLSRLDSTFKILEITLLTAMGALGIGKGFNGRITPDEGSAQLVCRGMDSERIAFIRDNFPTLKHHYFAFEDASSPHLQIYIHNLSKDSRDGDPLSTSNLNILVGWRLGNELRGLMGLGPKIKEEAFLDDEISFIYSLTDHMLMAMQTIATKSVIHTLQNELEEARQRTADITACSDAAAKDLEETLFRLSGFNDIIHELSGHKESTRVVDAFLLVLIGIFSAQNGHIFYWGDPTQEVYITTRSPHRDTSNDVEPAIAQAMLQDVFKSPQALKTGAMQAAIIPAEPLNRLHPWITDNHITILFKVDDTAKGLLCLGKRLVETQYGPRERELLLAFTHNFLVFLKNSRSFETIQRLHAEQEHQNLELTNTIRELTSCKSTIDGMEKAGERIKAAISKTVTRTKRVSLVDMAIIIIAGTLLGLLYNFASPSGVPIIPQIWQHPSSRQINVFDAKTMAGHQKIIIVDARPVEFYNQEHIKGALNLPPALFDFVYMMRFSQLDAKTPIIVYGRTFSRHYDETIAYKLSERGHRDVFVLGGGLKAWQTHY